jgi:hypothetical protein
MLAGPHVVVNQRVAAGEDGFMYRATVGLGLGFGDAYSGFKSVIAIIGIILAFIIFYEARNFFLEASFFTAKALLQKT